jgi:glycerol kinase
MQHDLILAIDQGTTNSKAVLVDRYGNIASRGTCRLGVSHPEPGWVEQSPFEIWGSVREAVAECLAGQDTRRIAALGISNQRESVLAWDAQTGEALGPCITWQCRRTADICASLKASKHEEAIRERTGLPVDPLFSATKIRWLLEHIVTSRPSVPVERVRVGTVDSWLLWQLTGGAVHACDESNAARTQLFNIVEGYWDPELLSLFDIPASVLPEVRPSDADFGLTRQIDHLPDNIPIRAAIGDSHAALFAHGATTSGLVKATYGTGSSLMTLLGDFAQPQQGLTTTVAWSLGGHRWYALEGNISVSASSLPWAARWLGLDGDPGKLIDLAQTVDSTGGVYFVPALVGLGAPYWESNARGSITGLTFNTGSGELARAIVESIAFQVHDVFSAMSNVSPGPLASLIADGGASRNSWLMQFQADLLGLPLLQADAPDASALGAAFIAGLSVGLWSGTDEVASLARDRKVFLPTRDEVARAALIAGWNQAIARTVLQP